MLKNLTRLVSFRPSNAPTLSWRVGALYGDQLIDLSSAHLPSDMKLFLSGGPTVLQATKQIISSGKHRIPLSQISIGPPIANPEKIICVGLNYRDHAMEAGLPLPTEPIIFSKFSSAIIGAGDTIVKPEETNELDYEVELVVVIGKEGKSIPVSKAFDHIAGYTIGNDVTARDWQLKKPGGQWLMGKTFDTFAPIGPAILLKDDAFDAEKLGIRCYLNDQLVQNSRTDQLVFGLGEIIARVSKVFTLKVGDLIFTGTPGGVGFGRKPPVFLKAGDCVRCEIDHVGELKNQVS